MTVNSYLVYVLNKTYFKTLGVIPILTNNEWKVKISKPYDHMKIKEIDLLNNIIQSSGRPHKLPTIKDVAKLSGVSASLVSRYLNNDITLSIKPETKERIIKAVKELNYKPNTIARALRSNTMRNIAVLVSDIANPFFAEVFIGAQEAAHKNEYTLTLYNTGENADKERDFIDMIARGLSDGVLLTSAYIENTTIEAIERIGLKYILVSRNSKTHNGIFVTSDDNKGIKLAVSHLYENGHRRIAHISGPLHTTCGLTRLEAFRESIVSYGLECPSGYVMESEFNEEAGKKAMKIILSLPNLPTAVVAGNDLIAIGAVSAVHEAGYKVPDNISVVGFDDIKMVRYMTPPLTTISYDKVFLGYSAASLLIDSINSRFTCEKVRVIDVSLIERSSVKRLDTL